MNAVHAMRMMDALGYCYEWLSFGFLSEETLAKQYARLHTGGDQSTEHYRFASFEAMVARLPFLTQEDLDRLLLLVRSDPDQSMGKAVVHLIAGSPKLLHWQEEMLEASGLLGRMGEQVWFQRATLRRNIASMGPTEENCALALETKDGAAQAALLKSEEAPKWFVKTLASSGANKSVRGMARQVLRRYGVRRPRGDRLGGTSGDGNQGARGGKPGPDDQSR